MRLAIECAALLKSLAHVQSVVERRTTIPILSNVKIEAAKGAVNLTATDMDLTVVEQAEAEVSQPGSSTAPAHTLYDVVRKLPEGSRIQIERADSGAELTLRAGRSTFDLPCLPAADFPTMTDEGLEHSFSLKAGDLRRVIDKTRFAISTEETRYYLTASSCTRSRRMLGPSCAVWPRTAIASPASRSTCPPAPRACRRSSCRARPWPRCAS